MPQSRRNTLSRGKADTFIGFCVRAGKISLGSGAVDVLRKGVYLLVLSADASENTQKLAVKYKNRLHCPLIICKSEFDTVVNKPGCKIAAIRDKQLSKAILDNLDDNYELYAGGNI